MHLHNLLCLGFRVSARVLGFLYFDCHLLVHDSDAASWRARLRLVMQGICLHMRLIHPIYIPLAVVLEDLLHYCSCFVATCEVGLLGRLELRNASWCQADCLLAVEVRDLLFLQRSRIEVLSHINS